MFLVNVCLLDRQIYDMVLYILYVIEELSRKLLSPFLYLRDKNDWSQCVHIFLGKHQIFLLKRVLLNLSRRITKLKEIATKLLNHCLHFKPAPLAW